MKLNVCSLVRVRPFGLKWAVKYQPINQMDFVTTLSFWRRQNAQNLALAIDAAYTDGFTYNNQRPEGEVKG